MTLKDYSQIIHDLYDVSPSDGAIIVARITDADLTTIREAGDPDTLKRLYKAVAMSAPNSKGGEE